MRVQIDSKKVVCDKILIPTPGYKQCAGNFGRYCTYYGGSMRPGVADLASPTWRRRRHGEAREEVLTPCNQFYGIKWRAKQPDRFVWTWTLSSNVRGKWYLRKRWFFRAWLSFMEWAMKFWWPWKIRILKYLRLCREKNYLYNIYTCLFKAVLKKIMS